MEPGGDVDGVSRSHHVGRLISTNVIVVSHNQCYNLGDFSPATEEVGGLVTDGGAVRAPPHSQTGPGGGGGG
jgi:hypothetical protein